MPQIREQIAMVHLPPSKTLKYLFHVRKTEKKQPLSTRQRLFLFNEINPFEICEMHFVREIAEVVGGFHFTFCANRKFRND